ncbi:TGD2 [Scenedesmus sp. PABB004]|nr:TGD2 [Scenedesmus sp. PABB004]
MSNKQPGSPAKKSRRPLKEAAPLLEEAAQLTKEVTPLLQELRAGGLVANLDHLTEAAAGAAADIQALQSAVLTDDNVRALRAAVLTLCKTLEHVESISADVSVFSRDTGVQRNLKTLITALSRIIEEMLPATRIHTADGVTAPNRRPAAVALAARQDEVLDGMMMNELQPVSDPVPRLLAEALGSAGAYGGAPTAIPTTTAPPAQSGASAASAGRVTSLLPAARDTAWEPGSLRQLGRHFWDPASRVDVGLMSWSNMRDADGQFNAFAMTRGAIGRFGLFDENLYPAYFEDRDFTLRNERMEPRLNGAFSHRPGRLRSPRSSTRHPMGVPLPAAPAPAAPPAPPAGAAPPAPEPGAADDKLVALLFADDCASLAAGPAEMQQLLGATRRPTSGRGARSSWDAHLQRRKAAADKAFWAQSAVLRERRLPLRLRLLTLTGVVQPVHARRGELVAQQAERERCPCCAARAPESAAHFLFECGAPGRPARLAALLADLGASGGGAHAGALAAHLRAAGVELAASGSQELEAGAGGGGSGSVSDPGVVASAAAPRAADAGAAVSISDSGVAAVTAAPRAADVSAAVSVSSVAAARATAVPPRQTVPRARLDVMGHPRANFCFAVTFPFHPYKDGRRGGEVTLVREYAQGPHALAYCLPTGGLDPGRHADVAECAARELSEEAWLAGGQWHRLLAPEHPGLPEVKWCMNRFVPFLVVRPGTDPQPGSRDAEEASMEVLRLPLDEFRRLMVSGEMLLPSITTAYMALDRLHELGLLDD